MFRNCLLISLWLFGCLLLISPHLQGQTTGAQPGHPGLTEFSPETYQAGSENYQVTQADNGLMIFANGRGVLLFDGVHWELVPVPTAPVYAVATGEQNRIYVGAVNDFGYLEQTDNGSFTYRSLYRDVSAAPEARLGYVERILVTSEGTFFLGEYNIYQYAGKQYQAQYPDTGGYYYGYALQNRILLETQQQGLKEFRNGKWQAMATGYNTRDKGFFGAAPFGEKEILLASELEGLYRYDGVNLTPFPTEADNVFRQEGIYSLTALPNGSFAVGTAEGKVFIISSAGKLVFKIGQREGIPALPVTHLFSGQDGQLWIATEYGLFYLEYPSPVSYLGENDGLLGDIRTLEIHRGLLYVGTSQGLFARPTDRPDVAFRKVQGPSNVFDLVQGGRFLYAAGLGSYYGIDKLEGLPLIDGWAQVLHPLTQNPGIVAAGVSDGVDFLQLQEAGIQPTPYKVKLGHGVTAMVEDNAGNLWLETPDAGVVQLKLENGLSDDISVENYDEAKGLPSSKGVRLFRIGNFIIASTNRGLFQFDPVKKQFIEYEGIAGLSKRTKIIALETTSEGDLLLGVRRLAQQDDRGAYGVYAAEKVGGNYKLSAINLPEIRNIGFLWSSPAGRTWVANLNTFVIHDSGIRTRSKPSFKTLIGDVFINEDSLLLANAFYADPTRAPEIDFSLNTIAFHFSAARFDNAEGIRYQYRLEGGAIGVNFNTVTGGDIAGDENELAGWSLPQSRPFKEFTNLAPGDYVFKVRAIHPDGTISEEASLHFSVLPPWYLTTYALVGALAGLLLLGFLTVRLYSGWQKRRVLKENKRLEALVQERTSDLEEANTELLHKKEEIEAQSEQLAEKNEDLKTANQKLKAQQTQIVASEKLAALGKLTPSVAHEINTPLGAILGAVSNIEESIAQSWFDLAMNLQTLPHEHQGAFWAFVEKLRAGVRVFSSKEERRYTDRLEEEFRGQGVMDSEGCAKLFVKVGVVEDLQDIVPPLKDPVHAESFLRTLSNAGRIWRYLKTIQLSGERARHVIQSLKAYTRKRQDESGRVMTDLAENIDMVLTVYNYYLMQNLELHREYQPVPNVSAYPEQLMQVWTNLVTNASEAMTQRGNLWIRLNSDQDKVYVVFENDGPKIPDHQMEKIFDWQYTTKGEDGGSGMGLAISRDIIRSHGGEMKVSSTEERTVFTVSLPLKGSQQQKA